VIADPLRPRTGGYRDVVHRSVGTRLLLSSLVALVLVVALAACGSDDDSSSNPTNPTPKTAVDAACKLLTAADATTLFGLPAEVRVEGRPKSVASQCIYQSPVIDGQLLQFRIFDDPTYYSKALVDDGEVVTGLGRKAYIDAQGPDGIVDLQFVNDGRVYALAYSNASGDAATRATKLELLARAIDDRL
jgi:hypothetical protein